MCLRIKIERPELVVSEGKYLGFEWVTIHNDMGFRCGYVKIEKSHPFFGKHYDDIPIDCHGGVTFADYDVPCNEEGEDDAYWIGFDCGNYSDLPDINLMNEPNLTIYNMFGFMMYPEHSGRTLKTQEYVENQCKSICEQLLNPEHCSESYDYLNCINQ